MMQTDQYTRAFEKLRPVLTGLAYRMLGSKAEADDVVQDVFLAWMQADKNKIEDPRRWLMAVCSRRAIDVLRSARVSRTSYVGPWLPEPLQSSGSDLGKADSLDDLEMAQTVTTAFLLALERLSPKERAAFILHDIFDLAHADVATAIGVSEPASRKLTSRARAHVREDRRSFTVPLQHQETLANAFLTALSSGDTSTLTGLLANDIVLQADSGGKAIAVRQPLQGQEAVLAFVRDILGPAWQQARVACHHLSGAPALVVTEADRTTAVMTFGVDAGGKLCDIFIMRNPDKLTEIAL